MSKNIERFNEDYFISLKTQKEKENYFMSFIKKAISKMEKGGVIYDNGLCTNRRDDS